MRSTKGKTRREHLVWRESLDKRVERIAARLPEDYRERVLALLPADYAQHCSKTDQPLSESELLLRISRVKSRQIYDEIITDRLEMVFKEHAADLQRIATSL